MLSKNLLSSEVFNALNLSRHWVDMKLFHIDRMIIWEIACIATFLLELVLSDHLDVFDAIKAVVTLLHILDLKADMLIPTDIALTLRKLVAIPFGVVGDIAGAYGTVRPIWFRHCNCLSLARMSEVCFVLVRHEVGVGLSCRDIEHAWALRGVMISCGLILFQGTEWFAITRTIKLVEKLVGGRCIIWQGRIALISERFVPNLRW